jgi:aspartate/methionine/tyrosine aminotransferase
LPLTTPHPAERISRLGFSDIVRIRNRVLEMQARGARVLRFEGGEPFMPTPPYVKDAMREALDRNETRYAPSSGVAPLLEAIVEKLARQNRLRVDASNVIVTSGGAHGLFCAFQSTVNEGDDVMFFSPYWTPIKDQVTYCGGRPVLVPWDDVPSSGMRELLERHVTDRTRVLYVNSPSNPTGNMLTIEQLRAVAEFATEHDLAVIADEAYEDLVFDREHVSIASLDGMFARTITVFTLSKSFAMTGWRAGYVVADALWMDGIRKLVLNSINGVSTPTQFAAAAAIRHGFDPAWTAEYRRRRDLLVDGFANAGFRLTRPPGAFYLFPDVRDRLGNDSWKAMETLLDRTSIASVPGAVFGPHGEGHLRMSFSVSIEMIEEAVEAVKKL